MDVADSVACVAARINSPHFRILVLKDEFRIGLVKRHSFSLVASSAGAPTHFTNISDLGRYLPLRTTRRSRIALGCGRMVEVSETGGSWLDVDVTGLDAVVTN